MSWAPEATGFALAVLTTLTGLAGSARTAGAAVPRIDESMSAEPKAAASRLRIDVRAVVRPTIGSPSPAPAAQNLAYATTFLGDT